jgi:hypothetical protein
MPTTGKLGVGPGSVFYCFDGGRIVEFRGQVDGIGLFLQVGATWPATTIPAFGAICARQRVAWL